MCTETSSGYFSIKAATRACAVHRPPCQRDLPRRRLLPLPGGEAWHLSLGVPDKSMDKFGPRWVGHTARLESNWRSVVGEDDLVLVPGDISWAMRLEGPTGARPDLDLLGRLPGTKVLIKGNHDYWWQSVSSVRKALPEGMSPPSHGS